MKKNIVIVILLSALAVNICLNLMGFNFGTYETQEVPASNEPLKYMSIVMEEKFLSQINNNPIDVAYQINELELIQGNIAYIIDYQEAWENQILFTTEELSKYLSEDDFADLVEANYNFFEYLNNTKAVEIAIYEPMTEYRVSNGDMPTGDGLHFLYIYIVNAERTKQRAVELLSYLYTFTSEVDFMKV